MSVQLRYLVLALVSLLLSCNAQTTSCDNGVARQERECVEAGSLTGGAGDDGAVYFCTDRFIWRWSEEPANLPHKWSDAHAISMDPAAIPELDQPTMVVFGGCEQDTQDTAGFCGNLTNDTQLYNPLTNTFTAGAAMLIERWRFASANVSQHIFEFGGKTVEDGMRCEVTYYNVLTDKWTLLEGSEWENCTSDASAFVIDGEVYLTGGYSNDYVSSAATTKVTITYDAAGEPESLTYTPVAPMLGDRGDHHCWSEPGSQTALCLGGYSSIASPDFDVELKTVEQYDAQTDTWTAKSDMNVGRGDFALSYLNGRLTVVAGERFDATAGVEHPTGISSVEWYDPKADCWSSSSGLFDLPFPRFRCSAAVYAPQNKIFVFGGQGPAEAGAWPLTDDVFVYQETQSEVAVNSGMRATAAAGATAATVVLSALLLLLA